MATPYGPLTMIATNRVVRRVIAVTVIVLLGVAIPTAAQTQTAKPPGRNSTPPAPKPPANSTPAAPKPPAAAAPAVVPAGATTPPDYVIGPDDALTVIVWREKDMSGEVVVRPDGKISLPLLNEMQAAGLTPEQLRLQLTEAVGKFVEDPTVAVVVKTINSRKVFVTGQVAKPGPYPLLAPTTVVQMLAVAGGVLEYADADNIVVLRTENGKPVSYRVNYKEVTKRKNLKQNIELKPGDTIVVP